MHCHSVLATEECRGSLYPGGGACNSTDFPVVYYCWFHSRAWDIELNSKIDKESALVGPPRTTQSGTYPTSYRVSFQRFQVCRKTLEMVYYGQATCHQTCLRTCTPVVHVPIRIIQIEGVWFMIIYQLIFCNGYRSTRGTHFPQNFGDEISRAGVSLWLYFRNRWWECIGG